jgi:hypothetical protein
LPTARSISPIAVKQRRLGAVCQQIGFGLAVAGSGLEAATSGGPTAPECGVAAARDDRKQAEEYRRIPAHMWNGGMEKVRCGVYGQGGATLSPPSANRVDYLPTLQCHFPPQTPPPLHSSSFLFGFPQLSLVGRGIPGSRCWGALSADIVTMARPYPFPENGGSTRCSRSHS